MGSRARAKVLIESGRRTAPPCGRVGSQQGSGWVDGLSDSVWALSEVRRNPKPTQKWSKSGPNWVEFGSVRGSGSPDSGDLGPRDLEIWGPNPEFGPFGNPFEWVRRPFDPLRSNAADGAARLVHQGAPGPYSWIPDLEEDPGSRPALRASRGYIWGPPPLNP